MRIRISSEWSSSATSSSECSRCPTRSWSRRCSWSVPWSLMRCPTVDFFCSFVLLLPVIRMAGHDTTVSHQVYQLELILGFSVVKHRHSSSCSVTSSSKCDELVQMFQGFRFARTLASSFAISKFFASRYREGQWGLNTKPLGVGF